MTPPLTVASYFSGVGTAELAAHNLGMRSVLVCEIDKHANAILNHHFPNNPNVGDINDYNPTSTPTPIDIAIAGSPCVGHSTIGKQQGFQDERSALALRFVEVVRIQQPRWLVLENVASLLHRNHRADFCQFVGALHQLGYSGCWRTLDLQYFGSPQRRRRIFFVGHLGDWRPPARVLSQLDRYDWAAASRSKEQRPHPPIPDGPLLAFGGKDRLTDVAENLSPTLRATNFHQTWANSGKHVAIATHRECRWLTPLECERLQGLPDNHTLVPWRSGLMPDGPRYRTVGNAFPLPIVQAIFTEIQQETAESCTLMNDVCPLINS